MYTTLRPVQYILICSPCFLTPWLFYVLAICSGCWFSTFTGFIHRMRGYHSVNHKEEGYEDGRLPTSYYYVPIQNQKVMHTYSAIRGAFFNREFPTSWRGIDASVGDIPHQEVSLLAEA